MSHGACRLTQRQVPGIPHARAACPASCVLLSCLLAFASIASAQPLRTPSQPPPRSTNGGLVARKLPRVTYQGGPYLRRPRVVTATFAGDEPQDLQPPG
jgi:hypothetical protein